MVREYSRDCWRELWNPESRIWQYIDRILFILMPIISLIFALVLHSSKESESLGVMIANLIWIIPLLIWFLVLLLIVPYRVANKYKQQRNEARGLVEQQREPSDSEVNDVIQLLEAETLVVGNNNGEERSYSFAEVFLAIADHLTVGFHSPSSLRGFIRKGLGMDERKEYFPYEPDDFTHLFGILVHKDLIYLDRKEYERMVTDYPLPNQYGVIDNRAYLPQSQHLEKGTDRTYYLSSLGTCVKNQLYQQSTAHKEGSQSSGEPLSPL